MKGLDVDCNASMRRKNVGSVVEAKDLGVEAGRLRNEGDGAVEREGFILDQLSEGQMRWKIDLGGTMTAIHCLSLGKQLS